MTTLRWVTALVALASAATAGADLLLHLDNGDRITVQRLHLDGALATARSAVAGPLQLQRARITGMESEQGAVLRLADDEIITGRIMTWNSQAVTVYSSNLGPVSIPLDRVLVVESASGPLAARGRGTEADTRDGPAGADDDSRNQSGPSRRSILMLDASERRWDLGLTYATNRSGSRRDRELALSTQFRFGLGSRADVGASIPYKTFETSTGGSDKRRQSGLGNASAAFRYLLANETASRPEWVGALRVTAPTGDTPDLSIPGDIGLASSHWSVSTEVNWARTLDPVVLFGTLGYRWALPFESGGSRVDPGDAVYYGTGVAFIANPSLVLSTQLAGEFRGRDQLRSGVPTNLRGSAEPMMLRTGFTLGLAADTTLSGSVAFGLNDDAVDAFVALYLSQRF